MSAQPVQVTPQPPSPTLDVRNNFRGAKMMHNLPPVFSPDNSPPITGSSSRKHYLPLVSPVLTEDNDRPFDFSRRRGSTPSLQKSSASQYFEDLRKRRRGSESINVNNEATMMTSDQQAPVYMQQKEGNRSGLTRFAELPTALAQTIVRALEDQARNTNALKKRTMSLPSSSPALGMDGLSVQEDDVGVRQRRASMRSRQLALLASQARLARTGSSSVQTALVAERAVKGAIQEVVEDLQASKISKSRGLKAAEDVDEKDDNIESFDESKEVAPESERLIKSSEPDEKDKVETNPRGLWSQALSSPQIATAFLESASEVAHDWANGFYRFEGEWAGDALRKEQMKLSETQKARKRQREEDALLGEISPLDRDESPPKAQASRLSPPEVTSQSKSTTPEIREPSPASSSSDTFNSNTNNNSNSNNSNNKVIIAVPPSLPSSSARSSLMAAQKRLSMSLPAVPVANTNASVEGGGQLVDVLSNFVSLIEQRKEGCHGLEKLAQDARRLSTFQLPSISTTLAQSKKGEEEANGNAVVEEASSGTRRE